MFVLQRLIKVKKILDLKQHYDAEVKKLKSEQELALYYLRQDHETQIKRKERLIETVIKMS